MIRKSKYSLGIIIGITIITIVTLINFYTNKNNKLNEPQKIISHQYGKNTLELSKNDELFDELFNLTNKRIIDKNLIRPNIPLDEIYSGNYTEILKQQCSFIEFIYDKEQTLHIPLVSKDSSTKKEPIDIKYYRLCFTLGDSIMPMDSAFRYGNKENYYSCFIYGISNLKETQNFLKNNNID